MQAHDEHALAAEVVGDAAAQQQQAGEGQRVRRQHPLAVGRRDVQRPLRRGQGDDDDGGVEHHHQLGDGDDAEGAEALGVTAATVPSPASAGSRFGSVEGRGHWGLPSPGGRWSCGPSVPVPIPAAAGPLSPGLTWRGWIRRPERPIIGIGVLVPLRLYGTQGSVCQPGEEVRSVGPKSNVPGGCDEPTGEERPLRADAAAQPGPHPRGGRGGLRRRGHRGPRRRDRREGRRRRGHALPALPDQGEALRGDPPRSPARAHRGRPRPGRRRGPRRPRSSASSSISSCSASPSAT